MRSLPSGFKIEAYALRERSFLSQGCNRRFHRADRQGPKEQVVPAFSRSAQACEGESAVKRFLNDHLIEFDIAASLVGFAVAHFYFGFGWIVSVVLGLSTFILIPLLVVCWLYVSAIFSILIIKRFKD